MIVYIVYYLDDFHKQHMTFVKSYKDINFLKDRFGEITIETCKIKQKEWLNHLFI